MHRITAGMRHDHEVFPFRGGFSSNETKIIRDHEAGLPERWTRQTKGTAAAPSRQCELDGTQAPRRIVPRCRPDGIVVVRRARLGGVVVIEYDTWPRSLYANCVPPYGATRNRWTVGCGAMAQLVARLHGMQKVRGSNPLSSTQGQGPVSNTETGLICTRTAAEYSSSPQGARSFDTDL